MDKRDNRVKIFTKTFLIALLTIYYSLKAIIIYRIAMSGDLAWKSAVSWANRIRRSSGVEFEVSGLEGVNRDEPYIIVANHFSAADIPALISSLPVNFRFIAKRELLALPFLGKAMECSGNILVDRDDPDMGKKVFKESLKILARGKSILVFAEGTRGEGKRIGEFQKGAFLLAKRAKLPLIPLVISGTEVIMPRGKVVISNAKVFISFLEEIIPSRFANWSVREFMERVRNSMIRGLSEIENVSRRGGVG